MKITVRGSELAHAVGQVRSVVGKKSSTMLGVSCILLETYAPSLLKLRGTDLSQSVSVQIPAEITDNIDSVLLPADKFSAMAQELRGAETIKMATSETFVLAMGASKGGKFTLAGLSPEEWPGTVSGKVSIPFSLSGDMLAQGIRGVEYAAERGQNSRGFTAVCCDVQGNGSFDLATTDGSRMAYITVPMNDPALADHRWIIPLESAQAMMGLFTGAKKIMMSCDEYIMTLTTDEIRYTTRLLAGVFPDWKNLIPTDHPNCVHVPTKALVEALRRVLLIHDDRPYLVTLNFRGGEVDVLATSEAGSVEETISTTLVNGSAVRIAFNAKYMLDWLGHVPTEMFSVEMGANGWGPMRCTAEGAPGYLLIPIVQKTAAVETP